MEKYSSHCWSFRIIFKYAYYVIIIGWFRSLCAFGVVAFELQKNNHSIASATQFNEMYQVPLLSPTKMPSAIVSTVTESIHEFNPINITSSDGPMNHELYYHCRCWNSTVEVSNFVQFLF